MAGKYRYERDGQPTGAVESWRLTAAAEGYRFLRVDLDARVAASGHTYLYHALVNADGQVERLQYRFWTQAAGGLQVTGNVVLESDAVTAMHTVNGKTSEQVLDLPTGYRFWFPAVVGLHFAGWRGHGLSGPQTVPSTSSGQVPSTSSGQVPLTSLGQVLSTSSGQAVALNGKVGDENTLAVQVVDYAYFMMITDFMEMEVMEKVRQYVPFKLSWGDDSWRIIQRDADNGWPLGMVRDDGLTAVVSQFIQYK